MTTAEVLPVPFPPSLLRNALKGNAAFSAFSGIALAAAPSKMSALIGVDLPFIFALLGVGLVLYAVVLFFAARQQPINRALAWNKYAPINR